MIEEEASRTATVVQPGEIVADNYEIVDVLGIGGMGVVYKAVQRSLDRVVAIKLPRPELAADLVVRRRLRCEAIAGARIDHPNIVRVLDFGSHREVPFVVMEHVAGPRLAHLLAEHGPLPVEMVVQIARQIVAGLQDAHDKGVIHADVKCDNVLVETLRDGNLFPRLIDFGIARFVDDGSLRELEDTTVIGTPEYLAPEVIRGEPPGFTADVYAIGIMLYELVSGATPFGGGTSATVMMRGLEDDAVPLTLRCPDDVIPTGFEEVVMRSLAKDPADRFADARMLAKALDSIDLSVMPEVTDLTRVRQPPPIFSMEATTATMSAEAITTAALDASEQNPSLGVEGVARDADTIVVSYLELARSLVDDHRLPAAIAELERGIAELMQHGDTPVWRLWLTLAAVYDGVADRTRARVAARQGRECAVRVGAMIGVERADLLLTRLELRHSVTRRERPW
ncbi:MAG TPA: serine/threonine-protein kinase [Kofleriaceae bacterium]|nr:serine/threonine-protein kinase [Kofleriaceae bacterium]